jgi:hypothetical protein
MSPRLVAFNLSVVLLVVCAASVSPGEPAANKPIWSKKGTTFPVGCNTPPFNACRFLRIPSPNAKSVVEISYDKPTADYPDIEIARIQVKTNGKFVGEVLPVGTVESELVWSPDSKGFFINGNDNGYGDDHFAVHLLDAPNLGPGYIGGEVEDMVRSFPPCLAKGAVDNCAEIAADRDYFGMVGLDWIGDSSRVVVMAQVICSSSMGGIMCGLRVGGTEGQDFAANGIEGIRQTLETPHGVEVRGSWSGGVRDQAPTQPTMNSRL